MNALDIGARIITRVSKISTSRPGTPVGSERASRTRVGVDGEDFQFDVTAIVQDADPRPLGYDHVVGDRPRYDHIRLAEMASKALSALAGVSKDPADVVGLEVWHKRGVAGFLVRTREGARFLVETRQV
jgi:hypothetical protein